MKRNSVIRSLCKWSWAAFAGLFSLGLAHVVMSAPAQEPLFLAQPVRPIMMLNMSRDHQLFFKLYDDYSNITDGRRTIDGQPNPNYGGAPDAEGEADTSYVHGYNYYGYFDSEKCYEYNTTSNRFNPTRITDDGYCNAGGVNNEWSGNFLNWTSMTRMDAVRKILYGGMRQQGQDTSSITVLERAFLPQDAHSFAKYYNGTDIGSLTPFGNITMGQSNNDSGITICNTTEPTNRNNLSQSDTGAPLMRIARGNFSLWASNERWQCRWGMAANDNNPALSGIVAHTSSPANSGSNNRRLGGRDFIVRVKVCDSTLEHGGENCKDYNGALKPIGLLQEYGEDDQIHFGLMTGSYTKNKSGGVLRKTVGSMVDEVNANGTFKIPASGNSIVGTLDRLRIYGYRFDDGTYHRGSHSNNNDGSDACVWSRSSFSDGHCTNWGNPQSEIFLESLRYLSGQTPNSAFVANDSGRIAGLNTATWDKPVTNNNYCAPLSVLQFNASTSSYDDERDRDQINAADIGLANVDIATNAVGEEEGIHGNSYFVGENGAVNDANSHQLCTAKSVGALADVRGTCPDAPRLEGSYQIAGLAYHARKEGIPLNGVVIRNEPKVQTVKTYGVALAPAVPRVIVPVPGSNTKNITILPACRNALSSTHTNCAIVDFKIVSQQFSSTSNSGKLYVNWEDSEAGGDFDQDMWGIINYSITPSEVTVTTQVIAQSTGDPMGFGYVISGTQDDGFHVHSGVNNFTNGTSCTTSTNNSCTCRVGSGYDGTQGACNTTHARAVARSKTFQLSSAASNAQLLESPLYYAAKWGGYDEDVTSAEEIAASTPETYFYATDPRDLEAALRDVFNEVKQSVGSASTAATNSTRLTTGSAIYQASFNTDNWWGELKSFAFDNAGNVVTEGAITTSKTLRSGDTRSIYVSDGENLVDFEWDHLNEGQKNYLIDGDDEATGSLRVEWLRGESTDSIAGMRVRKEQDGQEILLGDIVNSSPVYMGATDLRYGRLPGEMGNKYRTYLESKSNRDPLVFVGANDGMFHAFDAKTLAEKFAYVPVGAFPTLADLTRPGYGTNGAGIPHQYSVDGPIAVGDAYINGEWKSVVVGTLGAGGRGVFALDVTNPDSPKLLFELNDLPALGYVTGQIFIVPMQVGAEIRWAAVFGNGYESGSTQLVWVDLESKGVHTVVASATGSGLSAPALLPNGAGVVTAIYAGDLDGYMWKFAPNNVGNWAASAIFRAVTPGTNPVPQPITAAPTLGVNALKNNAIMVYFGTGKYLYNADNTTNIPVQSFYAIVDVLNGVSGRNRLAQKVMGVNEPGRPISTSTGQPVNWELVDGWYIDFPMGERVVTKSLLLYDKVIFSTMRPSPVPCEFGGSSWIMEVPAVGDKYENHTILDGNISHDFLILGDLGFGILPLPAEGGSDNGGDAGGGTLQCPEGKFPAKVFAVGSSGALVSQDACLAKNALGRMSWRQLR